MSNTKRKLKLIILIPIVVVALIGAVVLTLSLIKINPLIDNFGGYDRVELLVAAESEHEHIIKDGKDLTQQAIEDGFDEANFSIMQGVLEGQFSYGLSLKKETVTEDGKEVSKEVKVGSKDIKQYAASENEYVLKFYYKEAKQIEVEGKTIKYDTLLLKVRESNGEVESMDCIPYLNNNVLNDAPTVDEYDENGFIGSVYYETYVLSVKMISSRLMINLGEISSGNLNV